MVSLKSRAGEKFTFTMSTAMMIKSINLAAALLNSHADNVLRSLDVL